jgi:hypothetical protein
VPTAGFSEVSPEDGFAPLFNGRDLGGFRVVVKDRGVVEAQELFVVRDGAIHVYPTQADGSTQPFAGLVTRAEYSHYHLTLEYKWGARKFVPRADTVRDAGVLFHVHGDDIIWPDSVECQIQEGDTGDLWAVRTQVTSSVQPIIRNYAPAPGGKPETRGVPGRFQRFHRSYYHEVPGWNRIDVIVRGDHAIFKVNGRVVNEAIAMKRWDAATATWLPLTQGRILLQAEGAEVFYRNVRIKLLAPRDS